MCRAQLQAKKAVLSFHAQFCDPLIKKEEKNESRTGRIFTLIIRGKLLVFIKKHGEASHSFEAPSVMSSLIKAIED